MEVVKGLDACAVYHYCRPPERAAGRRGHLEVSAVKKFIFICLFALPSFAYPQQDSLVDVFPLAVNNSWLYNYSDQTVNIESGLTTANSGLVRVTVLARIDSSSYATWVMREFCSLMYHLTNPLSGEDTSYLTEFFDTVAVVEYFSTNHPLFGVASSHAFSFRQTPFDSVNVHRYRIVDSNGTATTSQYDGATRSISSFTFKQSEGLQSFSYNGNTGWQPISKSATLIPDSTVLNSVSSGKLIPKHFLLYQNYPKPFNPSTVINFTLRSRQLVRLSVFDILGREVATLVDEEKPAGEYTVRWNADGMPSGVYFYRMQAGAFTATKKVMLLR